MCGAAHATGIEIDPAAHANAIENIALNDVTDKVDIILGDATKLDDIAPADLFIANINRNIITTDIEAYASRTKVGGTMLLSGFYEADIPIITAAASKYGLTEVSHIVKGDGWTCLRLVKA
jgi:ribosomal protein L11 methyltransferase